MEQRTAELAIERRASLRAFNSFGLPATAAALVRLRNEADVRRVVDHPEFDSAVISDHAPMVFDTKNLLRGQAFNGEVL